MVKDVVEWANIAQYLKFFAERGIIVHVPTTVYTSLPRDVAREGIRAVSAHNDKLGVDWRKLNDKWQFIADATGK